MAFEAWKSSWEKNRGKEGKVACFMVGINLLWSGIGLRGGRE